MSLSTNAAREVLPICMRDLFLVVIAYGDLPLEPVQKLEGGILEGICAVICVG
jgi:hypothetical protein